MQLPHDPTPQPRRHERRSILVAAVLAVTILAFAAISITVVVLSL